MTLFGSTKKYTGKTKNGGKVPSLEVVEIVLVQCHLVDNKYLQKPDTIQQEKTTTKLRQIHFSKSFSYNIKIILLLDHFYNKTAEIIFVFSYIKSLKVLHIFTANKSYAYLLNVEPSNLVLLKTYNTEFDNIIITFTDQNGRTFEIEYRTNLTLLLNKQKCKNIRQNQEQENVLKDMDYYHLQENIKSSYWIQI